MKTMKLVVVSHYYFSSSDEGEVFVCKLTITTKTEVLCYVESVSRLISSRHPIMMRPENDMVVLFTFARNQLPCNRVWLYAISIMLKISHNKSVRHLHLPPSRTFPLGFPT